MDFTDLQSRKALALLRRDVTMGVANEGITKSGGGEANIWMELRIEAGSKSGAKGDEVEYGTAQNAQA